MVDSLCIQRAVRINGIPKNIFGTRGEREIIKFFEEKMGEDIILSVKIIMDYLDVFQIIIERNEINEKLEAAKAANLSRYEREKIRLGICCCKSYVDAEEEYERRQKEIYKEEGDAHALEDTKRSIGTAFVIFKSIEKATIAKTQLLQQCAHLTKFKKLRIQDWQIFKAPPPSDINWINMGVSSKKRCCSAFLFNMILLFVAFLLDEIVTVYY